MNIASCQLSEMSTNRQTSATTHAPIPKKKIIRPGRINSINHSAMPIRNHISSGFRNSFSDSIFLPFYVKSGQNTNSFDYYGGAVDYDFCGILHDHGG